MAEALSGNSQDLANIGGKLGLRSSHSLLRYAIANRGLLEDLD